MYLKFNDGFSWELIDEKKYESSYEMLKRNVNGYIECVSFISKLHDKGIDLWINEEGKLHELTPTVILKSKNEIVDVLCGNIVFARYDEEGATLPLREEDVTYIMSFFEQDDRFPMMLCANI